MTMQLRNTLSQQQFSLLGSLFSRGSFDLLKHCVRNVDDLEYFQTVSIAYATIAQSCLLNIDTGLGKTLIAAGIINVLKALKPKLRWVYMCQCSNLKTTADKLKKHLFSSNLIYCDSTESAILRTFFSRRAENADVIVLSYEAITQPDVESFLFKNRDIYQGIFLDESQMLSNLESHTSRLISAIINTACYRILLSATPLRINIDQVVNQIYMIDREMFSQVNMQTFLNQYRVWDDHAVIGYKNLEELQYELMPRMLSFSRSDLHARGNYTPMMKICPCGLEANASIQEVVDYKLNHYSNTMLTLLDTVKHYVSEGKHGLIYANRNVIKRALQKALADEGYKVGILDGSNTNTQQQKEKVHKQFLNNEFDVLITNITTGKDLPCDYVIFYELTFDYKQMIGRGERGLDGVDLDVLFIITDSVYEMRFFYANVYQRGILLEKLCGKDLPELHGAVEQLEHKLEEKGISIKDLFEQDD